MNNVFVTDKLYNLLNYMDDLSNIDISNVLALSDIDKIKDYIKGYNRTIYHLNYDLKLELDKPIVSKLIVRLNNSTNYKYLLNLLDILTKLKVDKLNEIDDISKIKKYLKEYKRCSSLILKELKTEIQRPLYYDIKSRLKYGNN